MRLILGIRQAEPDDTLNDMKNRGLEFEVISSETDFEDAHTEVTIDINEPADAFVKNVEKILDEYPNELEMLGSIFDPEAHEGLF
tara:strand:+ start:316 stop:570 length:255 start_codon:yes stop_codon:yes gene_type:complete